MPDPETYLSEIREAINLTKKDGSLTDFNSRTDAIDYLDFHVIDRIEWLLHQPDSQYQQLALLKQEAMTLKLELETKNEELFLQLREKIKSGENFYHLIMDLGGIHLFSLQNDEGGYDNLDLLINGILSGPPLPSQTVDLEPDMVFYQKTPGRVVFEMVTAAGLTQNDVFVDIGSGLGQACLLVKLLTNAQVSGIELEPAFCDYATSCAASLDLSDITFQNCDARLADFSKGTVFFMYTPFTGKIMDQILEMIRIESLKRSISIFTYGPCTAIVSARNWLRSLQNPAANQDTLALFKSV